MGGGRYWLLIVAANIAGAFAAFGGMKAAVGVSLVVVILAADAICDAIRGRL